MELITEYQYIQTFMAMSLIGQGTDIKDKEVVIKKCISLANRDMMSGGRFISKKFNKTSQGRINYIYKAIKTTSISSSEDYRSLIDKVCSDCFWNIDEERSIIVNKKSRICKSYGLAQKVVNMTFKYLYVFKDFTELDVDFTVCDCPIDSIILSELGIENRFKWTKITSAEYIEIQKIIDKMIQKDERYKEISEKIGRMAFDFNWN